MRILVIDNGTIHCRELVSMLKAFSDSIIIKQAPDIHSGVEKGYDLIVLTGSSNMSVFAKVSQTYYEGEVELIKNTTKPIIGICAGFELIAAVFGSTASRMNSKREGMVSLRLDQTYPPFQAIQQCTVYEAHRWVVTQASDQLIPLGWSDDGVEIFRHKGKPIAGMQFHPEVSRNRDQSGIEIFSAILLHDNTLCV